MVEEKYITYAMYGRLAATLTPLLKEHHYTTLQVLSKVKEPHLALLQLYFDIHSAVGLPDDLLRNFRKLGYSWMARAFNFVAKPLPSLIEHLYYRIRPDELPVLPTPA